jgi:hypothetical protein
MIIDISNLTEYEANALCVNYGIHNARIKRIGAKVYLVE